MTLSRLSGRSTWSVASALSSLASAERLGLPPSRVAVSCSATLSAHAVCICWSTCAILPCVAVLSALVSCAGSPVGSAAGPTSFSSTCMVPSQRPSRVFADSQTSSTTVRPGLCSQALQAPQVKVTSRAPQAASWMSADSSMRPKQVRRTVHSFWAMPAFSQTIATLLDALALSAPCRHASSSVSFGSRASSAQVGQAVAHVPQPTQRA